MTTLRKMIMMKPERTKHGPKDFVAAFKKVVKLEKMRMMSLKK